MHEAALTAGLPATMNLASKIINAMQAGSETIAAISAITSDFDSDKIACDCL
jgi:hypothetical protein